MNTNYLKFSVFFLSLFIFTACNEASKNPTGDSPQSFSPSTEFDVVILNGRVMDPETNFDAVRNVGVKDGKIALITEVQISGKESIDASGHVVTAGFIETHNHWQRAMGYKMMLRDGVTSTFDLEYGTVGTRVAEWYQEREGNCQVNFGTASSHEAARSLVLDGYKDIYDAPVAHFGRDPKYTKWSSYHPTLEEGNEVLKVVDKGLQDGAVGIGSTLGYMRDGASTREVFELQKLGGKYGRQFGAHVRLTPGTYDQESNSAQEILANAAALGAPVLVCHFNNNGWDLVEELIAGLNERGINAWGEIYPYAAGQTNVNAVFLEPEIWVDQLGHKYEETMVDPVTGEFLTREARDELIARDPTHEIILYKMPKEDVVKWLKLKGATMANDAIFPEEADPDWDTPYDSLGNMHPRTPGARGLSLQLGRENNIPLMHTLSQLSYNSAKHLGDMGLKSMQERGRMQEGMVADIVILDPKTVSATSSYEKGNAVTTGIPFVLVNGVIVVERSKVLKVFPGKPIRFEPMANSLFEPVDPEKWKAKFYAPAESHVHGCLPHPDTHPEYFD